MLDVLSNATQLCEMQIQICDIRQCENRCETCGGVVVWHCYCGGGACVKGGERGRSKWGALIFSPTIFWFSKEWDVEEEERWRG